MVILYGAQERSTRVPKGPIGSLDKSRSQLRTLLIVRYGERNNVPMNDVALVKTRKVIENGNEIALRLCNWDEILTDELTPHQIIGFCGMGENKPFGAFVNIGNGFNYPEN